MSSVHMLPSDKNLHIRKVQGYNNNILIAPASVQLGTQVDANKKSSDVEAPAAKPSGHIKVEKITPTGKHKHKNVLKLRALPSKHSASRFALSQVNRATVLPKYECAKKHDDTKAVLIAIGVIFILTYIWLK